MAQLPDPTAEGLVHFAALVRQWSPRINLVAPQDLAVLESRHIADSAQLLNEIAPTEGRWADLGSGAGFPGIVMALLLQRRDIEVHLVESDQRKAVFLRTAIRELGLDRTKLHVERIEALSPLQADFVSARALAGLPRLLPLVQRHLRRGGVALLMKGETWETEVAQARRSWHFDMQARPSVTDPRAKILHVSNISPQNHHGDREPEGRRGQDDHGGQPRGRAGRDGS